MELNLSIDTTVLAAHMDERQRRIAYAVVNAINKTAKKIQQTEMERAQRIFIIRKRAFMLGTPDKPGGAVAHIRPFASVGQGRLYAEIYAGSKTSGDRRLLLTTFEKGGIRVPFTPGAKSVAVPLLGRPARPDISRGVPYEYTFAGMHLTAFYLGKRLKRSGGRRGKVDLTFIKEFGRVSLPQGDQGRVQWKGRNRTFLLTHTKGTPYGGVFQRIGPKRGDIREIYSFRRGDKVPALLEWIATATRVSEQDFRKEVVHQLSRTDPNYWQED